MRGGREGGRRGGVGVGVGRGRGGGGSLRCEGGAFGGREGGGGGLGGEKGCRRLGGNGMECVSCGASPKIRDCEDCRIVARSKTVHTFQGFCWMASMSPIHYVLQGVLPLRYSCFLFPSSSMSAPPVAEICLLD